MPGKGMFGLRMKARAVLTILLDLVLFAAVLVLFALFHHVLPTTYEPVRVLEARTPAPQNPGTVGAGDAQGAGNIDTQEFLPGDFSATFPGYDTGTDAEFNYQKDDLRIAVKKVAEDGITYYVADVWVKGIELLQTAFAGDTFRTGATQTVRKMAAEHGAILAVSGDFCGAHKTGAVIRNGALYRSENGDKDVCVLYQNGVMEVYTAKEFSLDAALARGAWQVWSFGPNLLAGGEAIAKFPGSRITGKNPRCAIGYYEPGHYCLVIVDGRQEGYSEGMTLAELSLLMKKLGCAAAYNLDGGATAMMVYDDARITSPPGGGRASSDIIYFAKREG